jgi:hypothetical protein
MLYRFFKWLRYNFCLAGETLPIYGLLCNKWALEEEEEEENESTSHLGLFNAAYWLGRESIGRLISLWRESARDVSRAAGDGSAGMTSVWFNLAHILNKNLFIDTIWPKKAPYCFKVDRFYRKPRSLGMALEF